MCVVVGRYIGNRFCDSLRRERERRRGETIKNPFEERSKSRERYYKDPRFGRYIRTEKYRTDNWNVACRTERENSRSLRYIKSTMI